MAQVTQLIMPAPNPVTVENKNRKKGELIVKLAKVSPVFSIPKSISMDSSVATHLPHLEDYLSIEKKQSGQPENDLIIFSFSGSVRESREITDAFEKESMKEIQFSYLLGAVEKYPEVLCNELIRWQSIGVLPTIPFGHPALRLCFRAQGSGNDRKIQLFQSLTLEKSLYVCSYTT